MGRLKAELEKKFSLVLGHERELLLQLRLEPPHADLLAVDKDHVRRLTHVAIATNGIV